MFLVETYFGAVSLHLWPSLVYLITSVNENTCHQHSIYLSIMLLFSSLLFSSLLFSSLLFSSRFILLFGGPSKKVFTYFDFQKTHFFHMVHYCSIPFHTLMLCFSYRVRHLASFQSLVRVTHAHHLTGGMLPIRGRVGRVMLSKVV